MPLPAEELNNHPELAKPTGEQAPSVDVPENLDATLDAVGASAEGQDEVLAGAADLFAGAIDKDPAPGDAALANQVAESKGTIEKIRAAMSELAMAAKKLFTSRIEKLRKPKPALTTREDLADGTELETTYTQEELDAKAKLEATAAQEKAAAIAAAEKKIVSEILGKDFSDQLDQAENQKTEASPEESEELEGRAKEQYDAMVELAAAMKAYDIPELRPALKQLEQDLKGQDPADLIEKYNQGKQFEVLGDDGKPKLDEDGNTILTVGEASVVPPGVLAKALARLESEASGAVEKLSETVSEAGQEVEKLFSYEGVRPDTVEVVGESIGKLYDLGTSPLRVLKWVAWDKPGVLIVGGAAMAARAVGNLASGEINPFLNRSIGQAKGLEKIAELQKKLSALRREHIQAEHGNSRRKDTATDRARLARSSEPETYSPKPYVKDATTERLLSQVMDQVVRLPSDQISSEDREAIWKAIGTAQSEGNLETIFKENPTDGSMQLELAGITLPEGLTLGKFDQATVTQEKKRANYMISHEKTFRRACQRLAFKMFSGDKALQTAVLQGSFNSKIDQQGKWVISVIEGDKINDIPINDEVTAAVMEGIDSGKLNHNNELPPKYLEAIMTGEVYLPELDPEVSEAAAATEAFNIQNTNFHDELKKLNDLVGTTPHDQIADLYLKLSDQLGKGAQLFGEKTATPSSELNKKAAAFSKNLADASALYKKEAQLIKANASADDIAAVETERVAQLNDTGRLYDVFRTQYQASLTHEHGLELDALVTKPENAQRENTTNKFKAGDIVKLPNDKMKLGQGTDWKIATADKGCYILNKVDATGTFQSALVLTESQLDTLVTYQTNRGKPKGKPLEIKPLARRSAEVTPTPTEYEPEDDDSSDDEIAEAAKVVNLGSNERNSTERVAQMMDINDASQAVISDLERYTTSGPAELQAAAVFIRDNKGRSMVARVDRDGALLVGLRSGGDVNRDPSAYVTIEKSTYIADLKRKLGKEVTDALESTVNKVAAA